MCKLLGVWEPETLHSKQQVSTEDTEDKTVKTSSEVPVSESISETQNGYFSIRGEVIYHSLDTEIVIVKIRQTPKQVSDKPKFFKLKLKGTLPGEKPIGHFWDLQVQLNSDTLVIQEGEDIGLVSVKKKPYRKKGKKKYSDKRPSKRVSPSESRPTLKSKKKISQSKKHQTIIKQVKTKQ